MRPQQKKFVVEVKSSRRLKSKAPKSIWGTADLEIMARELSSPERPPVDEQSVAKVSPTPIVTSNDELGAADLNKGNTHQGLEARSGYVEDDVDASETRRPNVSPMPQPVLTTSEDGSLESKEPRGGMSNGATSTKRLERRRSDRRASSPDTGWDGSETSGSAGPAEVIFEDELLRLEDENRSLRRQLCEKLRAENGLLRAMLGRY